MLVGLCGRRQDPSAAAGTLEPGNRQGATDPGVKEALNKHGLSPQPTTRAELTAFMKKESAQWAATIKERKITAD